MFLKAAGIKEGNLGEIIMRVVQKEQTSSHLNEVTPAEISQSSLLERPAAAAKQPEIISNITISPTATVSSTPTKPKATISVVVTPAGKEVQEDVAVLPEQDVEADLVANQLTETEPIMPPSPGTSKHNLIHRAHLMLMTSEILLSPADDLIMQMIAGENLLPDKADTRSDAAIARVVAANPNAPLIPFHRPASSSSSSSAAPAPASPLSLLAIAKVQQKMSVEKKEQEAMLRLIESK